MCTRLKHDTRFVTDYQIVKKIYILVWSDKLQSRNWINEALHALRRAETEQKTKKVNAAGQRAVASVNGEVVNHPNIEFSEEGL